MSKEFIVTTNKRHIKRKMNDALGNDLVKILTELITNSDDSYRRLNKDDGLIEKYSSKNPIYVNFFKSERSVEIIDNAEGMYEDDLVANFKDYGADKSGRSVGHKTRGLFGQGASDVLFTQGDGEIISIKNDQICGIKFYWKNDERTICTIDNLSISKIRKEYKIPKNGSVVKFTLNEKVPSTNNLANKLSQFYMLRFVMNDRGRNIILKQFAGKKTPKEDRLNYEFPPISNEDEIYKSDILFEYEGSKIPAKLTIHKINKKSEKIDKYGELKILIYDDEKNVYDNTFFNLGESYPGTEHLFGYLELNHTADIIREKLNLDTPEEILTDSRDGLNKKHNFYKELSKKIEPLIQEEADKIYKKDKGSISSDNFKEHKKMFKEINEYLYKELDETNNSGTDPGDNPPPDGFGFIRDRIKITLGKKYGLKLLVNPLVISSGIEIFFENSSIENVSVKPESILVDYENGTNTTILYNIVIEGLKITDDDCYLTAKINGSDIEKKIFISVINEEIYYPNYGMEFKPDYIRAIFDQSTKAHLYVDTNKYPVGSEIKLSSTNKHIILNESSIVLSETNAIFENISRVDVEFISKNPNISGKIIANCENHSVVADIEIVESIERSAGKSGLISGWDITDSPEADFQKYFHPKNGKIIINSGNLINKYYFGENVNEKKIQSNAICQKYLAELISDEVAKFMVKKKIEKGQLGDRYEEATDEHQKYKNKLAAIVYKIIVE